MLRRKQYICDDNFSCDIFEKFNSLSKKSEEKPEYIAYL